MERTYTTSLRALMYDVRWQELRISCLAGLNRRGGWTTREGMVDNLRRLGMYLDEQGISETEKAVRVYRINNALNAVVMGYSGQGADALLASTVRAWRDHNVPRERYVALSVRMDRMARYWDWAKVERDLGDLRVRDLAGFKFLEKDLLRRSRNGSQRTRPDLYKFLEVMRSASV